MKGAVSARRKSPCRYSVGRCSVGCCSFALLRRSPGLVSQEPVVLPGDVIKINHEPERWRFEAQRIHVGDKSHCLQHRGRYHAAVDRAVSVVSLRRNYIWRLAPR